MHAHDGRHLHAYSYSWDLFHHILQTAQLIDRSRGPLPGSKRPSLLLRLQAPYPVNGSVEIELEVEQPSQCIVLHAAGMDITHAALLEPEHTHGAHGQVGRASCGEVAVVGSAGL